MRNTSSTWALAMNKATWLAAERGYSAIADRPGDTAVEDDRAGVDRMPDHRIGAARAERVGARLDPRAPGVAQDPAGPPRARHAHPRHEQRGELKADLAAIRRPTCRRPQAGNGEQVGRRRQQRQHDVRPPFTRGGAKLGRPQRPASPGQRCPYEDADRAQPLQIGALHELAAFRSLGRSPSRSTRSRVDRSTYSTHRSISLASVAAAGSRWTVALASARATRP